MLAQRIPPHPSLLDDVSEPHLRRGHSLCLVKLCRALTQETTHLADECRPGRIAWQENVVAAVERHEPRSGDAACNEPTLLEWASGVVTAMQNQRRRGDLREEVDDIDASDPLQQPCCIF